MAGNVKSVLSSGSSQDSGFAGKYSNGSRGTHSVSSLDRLGSFRENINGRGFSSGASVSRGKAGDLPPISQCLNLEPITLGDQRYIHNGELRRALGYSFGSSSEDNSFGATHSKPAPVLSVDDLKCFRGSIQDVNDKARIKVKKFYDSWSRLTAYMQKQQINEGSSGSNLLKTGIQSHRRSPDQMTQIMDDKGRSALSKRARTPVDMRLEGRGIGIQRQHTILGREKNIIKEGSLNLDPMEEKNSKLPAGGESWDKKMKRRRSVSNVIPRPVDGEGDIKRCRVSSDSGLRSSDVPPFRLASSNGIGSNAEPDSTPTASVSSVRPTDKSETEKVSLSRELGGMRKERMLQKGNNKLNVRDENHLMSPKGKASRAARTGPPIMDSPSSTFSRMVSTPEDWEQLPNVNKIHSLGGFNNRKRVFSSDLSSPPVSQWVGQRPQKMSRVRRTNNRSPTSNNDEALVSSETCAAPDFGAINSNGFNGSFPAWSIARNTQQLKGRNENTRSPAKLSGSEEIGAVENRSKERNVGSVELEEKGINGYEHVGSPGLILKKNKLLVKDEIGVGVRRQGRSGRFSSFQRGGMSALRGKLDSPAAAKPVRNTKPGSDKNGSKSGRPPLKKHSEHKGFTHQGILPNDNSPECTGESDDDQEDLIAAAQLAGSTKDHACSSLFWKKVEPLFSTRVDDVSFLKQQKDALAEVKHQPRNFGFLGEKTALSYGVEPKSAGEHGQESDFYCRRYSEEGHPGTPLYQRVLSALIMDNEIEELEMANCGRDPLISGREVALSTGEKIFPNGDTAHCRSSNIDVPSQFDLQEEDCSFMQPEFVLPASYGSNLNGAITPQINISNDSTSQVQYSQVSIDEKLLTELQSIGLYPDNVPGLTDGEEEASEEFSQLQRQLCQVDQKKKSRLVRMQKAVEEEKDAEERVLEQVAMNKLVELGHRKLLATRTATAARLRVSKVPKHVAVSFARRTLARCREFEDSGKSCFSSEPALRDVLLAPPPSSSKAESINLQSEPNAQGTRSGIVDLNNTRCQQSYHPLDRGKKKEISLDDVGNGSRAFIGNPSMGGAKGKRSERDRGKVSGRGERKAKSKPKQRPTNLSTHPVFPSPSRTHEPVANTNVDLTNLPMNDPIGLGDEKEFAGDQDLGSWLNFDEDNLQDIDTMGLEIPMDDLSDLNMLL